MRVLDIAVSLILGFLVAIPVFDTGRISSDKPIKLSYTLKCEDGKCDTTYKASTR